MSIHIELAAKDVALTVSFTALYTVLSFLPLSQVIGLFGKAITAATIIAPIIGIIIKPKLGVISTLLGGAIGLLVNPYFSLLGLVGGVITALCAGLLSSGKHATCIFTYFSLLFLFGFYPFVGPVWLYPPLMWFQITGFLILVSPIQSMAVKHLKSNNTSRLLLALFITFLTSTLAGQIAGSLIFELLSWPVFVVDVNAWKAIWQVTTFLYPVERLMIAFIAAFIGASLYKVLKSANLTTILNTASQQQKHS